MELRSLMSSWLVFCWSETEMVDAPKLLIWLVMVLDSPSPTVRMPMTAAMPMMMPSMVSSARILFARSPSSAMRKFSIRRMRQPPH